jgi:hypothetical protein
MVLCDGENEALPHCLNPLIPLRTCGDRSHFEKEVEGSSGSLQLPAHPLAFEVSHDQLFTGSQGTEDCWTLRYSADIVSPMRVRGKQIDGISFSRRQPR